MHEKMYDFEQSKRNNLIFYGIQADENETNKTLANKILHIIKNVIGVKREMFLSEVSRLDTGPAISNTKSSQSEFASYPVESLTKMKKSFEPMSTTTSRET